MIVLKLPKGWVPPEDRVLLLPEELPTGSVTFDVDGFYEALVRAMTEPIDD